MVSDVNVSLALPNPMNYRQAGSPARGALPPLLGQVWEMLWPVRAVAFPSLMPCQACLPLVQQHSGTHIQPHHHHHRAHPVLGCSRSGLVQPKHNSHGIQTLQEPSRAAGWDDGDREQGTDAAGGAHAAAEGRKSAAASQRVPHTGSISALIWQRLRAAPGPAPAPQRLWFGTAAGSNVCSGGCRVPRACA